MSIMDRSTKQMQVCILGALLFLNVVHAEKFLVERPPGYEAKIKAEAIRSDLQKAMSAAMGAGHGVHGERLMEVRDVLSRIFRTLPKNSHGRIERPMLRYTLHRYFAQRYSIFVKGMEPTRNHSTSANNRESVGADILLDQVPVYAESLLEGQFANHGFGLEDVVVMATTLEQLILGSGTTGLSTAFSIRNHSASATLSRDQFNEVLETYVLLWLVGDGADQDATHVSTDQDFIQQMIPKWNEVTEFSRGEVDRWMHEERNTKGGSPFKNKYSFADGQNVVDHITAGFGNWWEQECQGIKKTLTDLDTTGTGRVPLSSFYRKSMEGEWRFGESEAYLRELGALDDSSSWRGPQVIIPNYLLAASNCIVASTFYLVCCINECEALLSRVEDSIKSPVASVEELIPVVERLSEPPKPLTAALDSQLRRIADTHKGKIPLHGRLFSQWMHYAFPQECPFPHPKGKATARTPQEFGDSFAASPQEMRKHAKKKGIMPGVVPENLSSEEQWGMSQWLHEEELLSEYVELQPPRKLGFTAFLALALTLAAWGLLSRSSFARCFSGSQKNSGFLGVCAKQHLV
jgi:hypothetical protein